jgi:hypothetical protein
LVVDRERYSPAILMQMNANYSVVVVVMMLVKEKPVMKI